MSDNDSSHQHEVPQPDEREGEAEAQGFRWAPGVTRADTTNLSGVQDVARRISEQIMGMIAAGDRIRELQQALVRAAAPPPVVQWDMSGIVEQLRQSARISSTLPQPDFGLDLGRILAANQRPWVGIVRAFKQALEQLIPDNLRDLAIDDLVKVFEINDQDGTSLAWAPRTSLVGELLHAADLEERGALLIAHVAEIADDIDASLAVVALPEHQDLKAMLLEATAALRAGLYRPAQAAACAAFDTVVNEHTLKFLAFTGKKTRDRTRNYFHPIEVGEWDEATFADVALVLVGAGIKTAFKHWDRGCGLKSFNRHGSAHHADDGAYSPAHAVRATLIAHATLRWLDDAVGAERDGEEAA
ncbi:hypothetical protein ME763_32150 [Streptomyces murinus]|uniref:hypothetical protein n=1 Tax=Streptomyces murinus TaxID=33900 RepID=UPI000A1E3DF3|nr:hypothetical protein [Streptomyces murinus]WDO09943.1 hypothetical protein ME763_32150 [Streptomyces murinus]